MLSCPTEGVTTIATGNSMEEAFRKLDNLCGDPAHQWRELTWGTGKTKLKDQRNKELDKRRTIKEDIS